MADDFGMGYALGSDSNSGGGFGSFGEGLWAVIILAILFGRGGFGFGGGGFGGGDGGCATQADVRAAVDQQTLISKLDQQTYGLADSTYALNNTITNGFHGVDNAICNLGFNMQNCCCETQRLIERGFCDVGQAISMQTRDIIDNQNANYRGLMEFMVNSKIESLQAENQTLRLSASQAKQNQYLIDQLRPCPVPAYITCNPFAASYGYGTGFGTGYSNSGCGCGCG